MWTNDVYVEIILQLEQILVSTCKASSIQVNNKGALAQESHTGTQLVSPASACEKNKWTPPEQGLRTLNWVY